MLKARCIREGQFPSLWRIPIRDIINSALLVPPDDVRKFLGAMVEDKREQSQRFVNELWKTYHNHAPEFFDVEGDDTDIGDVQASHHPPPPPPDHLPLPTGVRYHPEIGYYATTPTPADIIAHAMAVRAGRNEGPDANDDRGFLFRPCENKIFPLVYRDGNVGQH